MLNTNINAQILKENNQSNAGSVSLDSAVCAPQTLSIQEEAHRYIERGWAIFPSFAPLDNGHCSCKKIDCQHIGKHPRTHNGFKAATTDQKIVDSWISIPHTNISIATGQVSGLGVLDVDEKNGGVDSIKEFEAQYGKLPDTPMVLTGSGNGSVHYYFKCPKGGLPSNTHLLKGVDFRCDGAYVIAPSSLHKSGRKYTWDVAYHHDDIPLADVPQILVDLIRQNSKHTDTLTKLAEPSENSSAVGEGQRNDALFRLASSLRNKGCCVESIKALLSIENQKRCSPPLSDSEITQIAASAMRYEAKQDVWKIQDTNNPLWLPPEPLSSNEYIVPVMPIELLPEALREWISDIAERMQIPLEMVAIPVICIISALIGCRLFIAPKKLDDWKMPPNLWAAVIARPGYMKSPAMKEAMKFVSALEAKAKKEYKRAIKEYEARKANDKKFNDPPPKLLRLITNDGTVPKIGQILSNQKIGILQYRDELFGFLKCLEKKGNEGDKQFFLEGFNGDSAFTYDRIERGTIDVEKLCISILGGIQPDSFEEYFEKILENRSGGDGFLPRFQLIIYPQRIGEWKYIDRSPDKDAKNRAKQIFDKIYEINFKALNLPLCPDDDIPFCRFTDEAQPIFIEWYEKHQRHVRSGEMLSPIIEAHIVKNAKLVPALALIFAVIAYCDPNTKYETLEVRKDDMQLAINWCEYLHKHMYKVYSAVNISPPVMAAQEIIKKIQTGEVFDGMSVRILKRNKWSKLTDDEAVAQALTLLQEHNWLKIEKIVSSQSGGAPSEVIRLNPVLTQTEEILET